METLIFLSSCRAYFPALAKLSSHNNDLRFDLLITQDKDLSISEFGKPQEVLKISSNKFNKNKISGNEVKRLRAKGYSKIIILVNNIFSSQYQSVWEFAKILNPEQIFLIDPYPYRNIWELNYKTEINLIIKSCFKIAICQFRKIIAYIYSFLQGY